MYRGLFHCPSLYLSPLPPSSPSPSPLLFPSLRLLAVTGFKTHQLADLRKSIRFEKFSYQFTAFIGQKSPGIRVEALDAPRESNDSKKRKSTDLFMAFQYPLEREFWYHIIVEVQQGWKQSQSEGIFIHLSHFLCPLHFILHLPLYPPPPLHPPHIFPAPSYIHTPPQVLPSILILAIVNKYFH